MNVKFQDPPGNLQLDHLDSFDIVQAPRSECVLPPRGLLWGYL